MKLEIRIISVSHRIATKDIAVHKSNHKDGTFYMELEYNHCKDTHYVEITYSTFNKLKIQTFPILLKVIEL